MKERSTDSVGLKMPRPPFPSRQGEEGAEVSDGGGGEAKKGREKFPHNGILNRLEKVPTPGVTRCTYYHSCWRDLVSPAKAVQGYLLAYFARVSMSDVHCLILGVSHSSREEVVPTKPPRYRDPSTRSHCMSASGEVRGELGDISVWSIPVVHKTNTLISLDYVLKETS